MVISTPALLVLAIFVIMGILTFPHFILAYCGILLATAILIQPFLGNISVLTDYVNDLSQDKRVDAPDLSFLSGVVELSEALDKLHRSWERQRKRMENIITEREILVDTLPDILIMLNDDKQIVRTNRAARLIFGQNLSQRHLKDVIDNDILLRAVQVVIEDLRGREVEFHIDEPTMRDFFAIVERFPIPSAEGISIVITLNDITKLKRIEQMRADFVANASHEIRTPLATIIGFIETLQGPAKNDENAREEFLKVMADQAARMSKLITDLLSLSKIEMNAHSAPQGKADIKQLINNEVQQCAWAAAQKNVNIRMEVEDDIPPVRGDENELAQVLHNLIANAIKYGFADSEVEVSARITHHMPPDVNFRNMSRAVLLSVRDQSDGIPKHHIPRLTERFYRVDTARSRKVGGTGLGLAIVKHILNRHRGFLTIDSTMGEGSVFSIYLPIFDENQSIK